MQNGVLYTAIGENYIQQAKLSAKSIKRFTREIEIACFTDQPQVAECEYFDQIIPVEKIERPRKLYMLDRLMNLSKTPYINTLALDTDTYVLEDISELFYILNQFDLAMCHGHNRIARYKKAMEANQISADIPYAFSPLQGGLILFKRNQGVNQYLEELVELYKNKQYYDDQISMRELIWASDLRIYLLPREYNFKSMKNLCEWAKDEFQKEARPKIFHYTREKKRPR